MNYPQKLRARFTRLVDRQLPSASIKGRNALFQYQMTRLRWPPESGNSRRVLDAKVMWMRQDTINWGCMYPFFTSILIAPILVGVPLIVGILPLVFFASVGYSLLSNISYVLTAVNTVAPQIAAAQWEPLRLTSLTETDILLANIAIIQVKVWRAAVGDMAVRAFLGLCGTALLFELALTSGPMVSSEVRLFDVLLVIVAAIFIAGFVLEPLWRMRTVTLMGMLLAIWIKNYGIALVTAFVGILALLLAEVIALLVMKWLGFMFAGALTVSSGSSSAISDVYTFVIFSIFSLMVIAGLYLFFRAINTMLFEQLSHIAFRE